MNKTGKKRSFCENCYRKINLMIYDWRKEPFDKVCLCDDCADLPYSQISRKTEAQFEALKPVKRPRLKKIMDA